MLMRMFSYIYFALTMFFNSYFSFIVLAHLIPIKVDSIFIAYASLSVF